VKPRTSVVGVNEGFTRHQIVDGRNGYLFDRGKENMLAVDRLLEIEWTPVEIQRTAQRYDVTNFRKCWLSFVKQGCHTEEQHP